VNSRASHFAGLGLLLLCFLAIVPLRVLGQVLVTSASVSTIDRAVICRFAGLHDAVPTGDCGWKEMQLPSDWHPVSHAEPINDAWFKLSFRLASVPEDGVALYATTFDRTGRVYVNGKQLKAIGSMVDPLPLNWNRSQFMVLPASMLQLGANELEIQERQYTSGGGALSAIRLGPEAVLRPQWERRVFWQNSLVEMIASATAVMGLVMLAVWLLRRSEVSYFWFGCTCWVWTLHNLDFFLPYSPIPGELWDKLVMLTNVLRAVVMYMFILRYSRVRMPRLETLLWGYFIVGAVALLIKGNTLIGLDLWFVFPLLATPYFAYLLVREGIRRNIWEGVFLFVAVVTEWTLSCYDAWLFASSVPEPVFLAQYATPIYVSVVGLSLVRHFVASMTDAERQHLITQRALEEANQATKDKNLFFSMVSHELKSPLQSIITVLATEEQRAGGHERRESLGKIQRAVRYMEAQIRDLFVLSVGEAGKLEMRSETFEVGDLVDEVVSTVSVLAAGKSIKVNVERPDDLLFVATDPKRVEQVLLNLLENAVKYTPSGSVTISYGLELNNTLQVTVVDTGIGIPEKHIGKLFMPFRRFALLDREHNSLGIGLAVVQTLLTHLGGDCTVESTPGVGSKFTFRIPVAVEKEFLDDDLPRDAVQLLIVDDRPEMLADLREIAETLGYLVDTAASAPEASNQLAVSAYDLVLIDLDMPVKNGYELASEIRRSDGLNSDTCLVAFSAGNPAAQGLMAVDGRGVWPFDSYEQKPVDARTMKRIVETRSRHHARESTAAS